MEGIAGLRACERGGTVRSVLHSPRTSRGSPLAAGAPIPGSDMSGCCSRACLPAPPAAPRALSYFYISLFFLSPLSSHSPTLPWQIPCGSLFSPLIPPPSPPSLSHNPPPSPSSPSPCVLPVLIPRRPGSLAPSICGEGGLRKGDRFPFASEADSRHEALFGSSLAGPLWPRLARPATGAQPWPAKAML